MSAREFLAQLHLSDRPGKGGDAGIKELRALMALVSPPRGGIGRTLERCRRDQVILRNLETGAPVVATYGMAPCEETITEFASQIAPMIDGPMPLLLPKPLLNRASAALHLQVGQVAVLLCGDLEEDPRSGCQDRGWGGAQLPPHGSPATLVKLGHHGSKNGDHDDIWSRLAESDCVTVAAPYTAQNEPLPRANDIDRVVARGHRLFVAGGHAPLAPVASMREGLLQDLVGAGISVSRREPTFGAVVATRVVDGSGSWDIQRFGVTGACP
jgi:hypothetical protein